MGTFDRKIIAEIGSVHDGSLGNAKKLIELAARCGADIVKFQTHIAEAETLRDAPSPSYFKDESRFEYFQRTAFTLGQWKGLKQHADANGVSLLSSPFSLEAVDLLEEVGIGAYKIPSGEISNLPLIERLARTGKPMLVSSGMSDWRDLDAAISALAGCCEVVPMQCTSAYPCPPERAGLNVLADMAQRYQLSVGYSDHTEGPAIAIAAAALGATVIEKHLTFSRAMFGSDAATAMEPADFTAMVAGIRAVWVALDNPVDKADASAFVDMKLVFEKSIVAKCALPKGHVLTAEDLAFKKPGNGIPAASYRALLGRRLVRDVDADTMLAPEDME